MNCKPGDLAVIVRIQYAEELPLLGKVIKVTSLNHLNDFGEPCWSYEGRPLRDAEGFECDGFPDEFLCPIRDQDGEDETLTWAGKPSDIKTPEAA